MQYTMLSLVIAFISLPICSLCIRKSGFSPKSSVFYRYILFLLGLQAFIAFVAVCANGAAPVPVTVPEYLTVAFPPMSILTLYFDRVSLTMFSFICFISQVVYRFSLTYLDGELKHRNFIFTLSCAIFSAQALVISGNLILFLVCWIGLSLSLHALLEYYPERQRAILAARKKFIISRIGDVSLFIGIAALYSHFNTVDISSLFKIAHGVLSAHDAVYFQTAALCIVGAAICKSAQFPFHTWLPDTLEAPTPVSALMHAGIVNGGGYALIRFSPFFASAELALNIATCVGAATAMLGMVVMWTQASIKKSLAWSTVMQMGLMILQCGLGAYALAFIHILGHGFYKAQAFLLSGTISEAKQPAVITHSFAKSISSLLLGIIISALMLWIVASLTGLDASNWPGGIISMIVLILALAQIAVPQFSTHNPNVLLRLLLCAMILSFVIISEVTVSNFYSESFAPVAPLIDRGIAGQLIAFVIIALFSALSILSCALPFLTKSKYGEMFYSHAVNGFYIGLYADRVVRTLWPQKKLQEVTLPQSMLGDKV